MAEICSNRIGKTSAEVTNIGFGGAGIGNLYTKVEDASATSCIQASYESGIRYFDTAPLYGHGLSEHRIGSALRERERSSFTLSTKVGRMLRPTRAEAVDSSLFPSCLPFVPFFDYSYDAVARSIEDSLQRLGFDRIDIVLIHDVELSTHGSQVETDRRFREAMDGGYLVLEKLRAEGVIKAIGCGVNEWQSCERFAKAGDFDCFLLAGRYTLLEQEALDSFLPLCVERNISIVIGGPFNTGILATGPVDGAYYNYVPAPPDILERVRRIQKICEAHATPLPAAALQFPLHHPAIASVIPGSRSAEEVARNIRTFTVNIPDALWADLKSEGLLRRDAPTP